MTAQQRRFGGDSEAAVVSWAADKTRVRPLAASALVRAEVARILARVDMEAIPLRAAQEALSSALACTWSRRAELLEWARPRPGDFTGNATTAAELAERDRRLAAQAQACRNKAALLELGILDDFEVIPHVVHR